MTASHVTNAHVEAVRRGRAIFRLLLALTVASIAVTAWLTYATVRVRFGRDVARLVFNDNSEALEQARLAASAGVDSLRAQVASVPEAAPGGPYIVVSIADRRLWYKQGDSVLFTAPVATGSGKTLVVKGGGKALRFETPRGRLIVQRRDSAPAWVPPELALPGAGQSPPDERRAA